jgi:hypothetical protein
MVMRDRSLWYAFAWTAVVSLTTAVTTAQDPEPKAKAPSGKLPSAQKPADKVPGETVPGGQKAGDQKAGDKTAGDKTAGDRKPGAKAAAVVPTAAGVAQPLYARVIGKEVPVRCFASQRSPFYEDILREGDVVMVGEATGEFRKVMLPLGVVGYVHRDFATAPVDGVITTTRPSVSFRYRPKVAEAPPQLLEQGTKLRYLAAEGTSWWKVRMTPAAAWVPIKEIQVFEEATPTLVKSYDALARLHAEQCAEAAEAFAKADAEARLRQEQLAKVAGLREQLQTTCDLPEEQQLPKLTALAATLAELQKELEKESAADVSARLLAADIKNHRTAVEAVLVLREKPKPATDVKPLPRIADRSARPRFMATGWLRVDRRAPGHWRFRLEKGRKPIAYITCQTGRYNLQLFDGLELGVRGSRSVGGEPVAPVIDVVRLEVLSVAPR